MADGVREKTSTPTVCELCGAMENLMKCAGCHSAFYCSKKHQKTHWKSHKQACRLKSAANSSNSASSSTSQVPLPVGSNSVAEAGLSQTRREYTTQDNVLLNFGSSEELILSTESSVLKPNTFSSLGPGSAEATNINPSMPPVTSNHNDIMKLEQRTVGICDYVVQCMNSYGICVVDNFLGPLLGAEILQEVQSLHRMGLFKDGQVVSKKTETTDKIRGDKITWREGTEAGCCNISKLISAVDTIVMRCNGKIGTYNINQRTKVS